MTSKCQFAILGGVPRNTTAKSEVQPSPAPTPRVAVPKARQLAFVYAPAIEGLSYPPDCPFKTQRAMLTRSKIASFGLLGAPNSLELAARPATAIELQQVHSAPYLEELQRAAAGDLTAAGFRMGLGGPDTPVFKDMFEYSAWACGAALVAAEQLISGQADIAFNLLGGFHHAMPARAGGFCYLNDVALACDALTRAGRRVIYLDVDAHHGDGVQEIFYERSDVFTISMHESGKTLYPWGGFENEIGRGPGLGFNVNIPLPAGTYDDAFLMAFERLAVPLIGAYRPDVIVLELGMDTLAGDPLTHLQMTNNVVVEVLKRLMDFQCPLLVAGGGGYHVENTVRAWALAWRTCLGDDEEDALSMGLGGVMLGSSEWAGGLRDRHLPIPTTERAAVDAELQTTLERVGTHVFPHHHLVPNRTKTPGD
ncbi:MAG: acetoin utilization protein AcuC [Verrucomicrobia subdivision 3 bacterium]|nr:acetoin utilization protein AcuC [Verrucomicrobiota bacterium]MCC6822075.1 acetoin utilization protein AcuC [Limisphaerales bacterium]